ncbi:2Fe-2S iron-sulfur cluster-binding protein [Zwartia sp.]|uniref:(2Fe-2S)-binding protein n=1 Tax=Zwartia sp. TaxID=2978004 RepID=UPI00271B6B94|nr:2Fe-2S iron-sulfur cluster-binding protein [Zwartia sp.]MDO9023674.1 (2Fe-2S)-binding protein [Zwartia sp.]
MSEMIALSLKINGQAVGPIQVPASVNMIEVLHEYLNLTGTRFGCGVAQCRACTVIVDQPDGSSEPMVTCIVPAVAFQGLSIRTIEGHAQTGADGTVTLSPVQQAFVEHFAFQCGYCTPGFVNEATILFEKLKTKPIPKAAVEQYILDGLNAHLCRCTGYVRYYSSFRDLILKTPGLTF